ELETGLAGGFVWINEIIASNRSFRGALTSGPLFQEGLELKGASSLSYDLLSVPEKGIDLTLEGGAELGRLLSLPQPFAKFRVSAEGRWRSGRDLKSLEFKSTVTAGKTVGSIPFD